MARSKGFLAQVFTQLSLQDRQDPIPMPASTFGNRNDAFSGKMQKNQTMIGRRQQVQLNF